MRDPGARVLSIPDLREGERVEGLFAAVVKDLRPFKDPAKGCYMHLRLRNRTGFIEGRIWEGAEELSTRFSEGDPVWVTAEVNNYRGTNQLVVSNIGPVESDAVGPEHFLPVSPRPREEMEAELWAAVEALPDGPASRFLVDVFADPDFYQRFTRAPAAKRVHHAYISGLLEHSLEVLAILRSTRSGDGRLDRELLTAGALLHDVGKIEEYTFGTDIDYSHRGRMIGHVVLGYRMLSQWLADGDYFPEDAQLHLGHLLLSHHGEFAYGAPILPQTAEAMALHQADMLSGKVAQVASIGAAAPRGGWSKFDRLLGRHVYNPPGHGDDSADPRGE